MEDEVLYPGLLLSSDTISEKDYLIWAIENIVIPQNINKKVFQYNQAKKRTPTTAWSCGLFWSGGAISDLTGYEYTEDDWNRLNAKWIKSYWLVVWMWMTMYRAVDCARDDRNERHPDNKISTYRLEIGSELFAEALRKWHSMVVGYKTSDEYLKDSQDDWVISWEDFPQEWGHLVRSLYNKNILIRDNYFGKKKFNEYINNKINKLKENGVYFNSAYIFLYDKTMNDIIKDNIKIENAKIAFDLWIFNGLNPQGTASREEVAAMIVKALGKWK